MADKKEEKLRKALKGEAVKDPKVGKPTKEKLDKILDKANKKK